MLHDDGKYKCTWINKRVYAKDIDKNVNGSLIIGWNAMAAAAELAKSFVSFEEGLDYEITIRVLSIDPDNII